MRKLFLGVLLLACLLLIPLLALRSERAVIAVAHWAVDAFSPYQLTLVNPLLRPFQGHWSADEIHLYPADAPGPPFLSVVDFSGDIRLSNLLTRTLKDSTVGASQVTIYVAANDSTEDPQPVQWLGYIHWLPKMLNIGQVHVVAAQAETLIFPVRGLLGQRLDQNTFQATGEAYYEGEPLELDTSLSAVRLEDDSGVVSMQGRFLTPGSGSSMRLDGELRGTTTDFEYEFQLDANYADVQEFMQGYHGERRLEGALTVKAAMHGDISGYTLSDARFRLDNMPHYGIEAAGTLDYDYARGGQVKLVAAGEVASMDTVLDWLDIDLGPLGHAQGSASVEGTLDNPIIERFLLRSESDSGLVTKLSGRVDLKDLHAQGNVLHFDLHGPNLNTLSQWLGELPFEPGPFAASAHLEGKQDRVSLNGLVIEAGQTDTVWARLEGSADNIIGIQQSGLAAAQGLALDLQLSTSDSRHLRPTIGLTLPEGFAIEGAIELQGDGALLQPVAGELRASSSDIDLRFTPRAANIRPTARPVITDLVADLTLDVSDTSALSQYTTRIVPVLGAVEGSATLHQRDEQLSLENIHLAVNEDGQSIVASGSVDQLSPLAGVALQTEFKGIDLAALLTGFISDFYYEGPLGTLEGDAQLKLRGGRWDLSRISLATSEPGGPVELTLTGNAFDLAGFPSSDSTLNYQLRDPSLLEALTGLRMNPSRGTLTARSGAGNIVLNNRAELGDTVITASVDLQHDQEAITGLNIDIHSPRLALNDLGLQTMDMGDQEYRPSEQLDELEPKARLERLLSASPRYPTDMALRVDGIAGENTRIQSLDVHITGEGNRYTLRRFNVGYADSVGIARGIIDLNAKPPFVSLAGEAPSLPLSTLGKDLGLNSEISGQLTVRGGLSAQGMSGPELVKDMDGSLALALENAVFEGAAYDLLATDLLAWIYSGAAQESSTRIDCTMAQFQLRDGVARSDSVYIETSKMVARGNAELDLSRRRMDISITPRSKSRSLQVPSSVRLYGPFDDPKTSLSPVAAAFDAYAELLALVPKLTRKLFGVERRKRARRPCEARQ